MYFGDYYIMYFDAVIYDITWDCRCIFTYSQSEYRHHKLINKSIIILSHMQFSFPSSFQTQTHGITTRSVTTNAGIQETNKEEIDQKAHGETRKDHESW